VSSVASVGGLYWWVRSKAHGLVWAMRHLRHELDTPDCSILMPLVMPGSVALDVGAHGGAWTRRLHERVGPDGSVMAFEALPYYASALRTVRVLLRLKHSVVIAAAAGAAPGRADLVWRDDQNRSLTGMVHLRSESEAGGVTVPVPVVTVDDEVRRVGRINEVSFVKIDVEGAELEVLRGCADVLRCSRPVIYLEAEARWLARYGHTIDEVFSFLEDRGYVAAVISAGSLVRTSADDYKTRCDAGNVVFLPEESAAQSLAMLDARVRPDSPTVGAE